METIQCRDRLIALTPERFIRAETARDIRKQAGYPRSRGMV